MIRLLKPYEMQFKQEEYWSIAFRKKIKYDELFDEFEKQGFIEMPKASRYWYADPFLFEYDGETYLFYEMFDRHKKKGSIAYSRITENEITQPEKVLETSYHLSFPFVFLKEETIYMLPESNESNEIKLFKAIEFPNKWVEEKTLIKNIKACDTIIFEFKNSNWLLTSVQEHDDLNNLQNRLYKFDVNNLCVSDEYREIKRGDFGVRNAGKVLAHNNKLLRVSQDCSNGNYGKSLIFWDMMISSDGSYNETLYKCITHSDINISDNNHVGIHTYNISSNYEVVDIKYIRENNAIDKFELLIWLVYKYIIRRIRRR